MKLKVLLNFDNEQDEYLMIDSATLSILTKPNTTFLSLLKQKDIIKEQINNHNEFISENKDIYRDKEAEQEQQELRVLNENIDNIIDFVDMIHLDLPYDEVIKYIEANPILKTKKISINGDFEISNESIKEVKEIFKNYPNIYIKLIGNDEEQSIKECEKTINKIEELANHIKKYNFSPLEQMMYAYDLVRDRVYIKEDNNDSYTESRDLTKALLGDKIVCLGYSNIYKALLNNLGLDCDVYLLDGKNNKPGHAINIAYIKDEKYNIDGIYFFDATADRKKEIDDNKFLNSYRFFAKTKAQIDYYYNNYFTDKTIPISVKKLYEDIMDFIENKEIIPYEYAKMLNHLSKKIDNGELELTVYNPKLPPTIQKLVTPFKKVEKEFILEKTKEYQKKLSSPIDGRKLLEVLYNIRKIEYYEQPEKYKLTKEELRNIFINSYWYFQKTKEEVLLEVIFGEKQNELERTTQKLNKHIEDYNLEQKIARIKLTKTLSRIKK